MANNTTLNPGSGGDAITDTDIGTFTAYSNTGKLPAVSIYVGPNTSAAPTPLSNANPLPVSIQAGTVTVQQATAANLKVDLSGTAANATALKVDGSAVVQPVSGTVTVVDSVALSVSAAQSGTWNVGTVTTVTTVSAVTSITNALPAGTNTIGAVTPAAAASGGATPYHLISAATTNATSVKASAGVVYSLSAFNVSASIRFLKLYDKASAPTVGTDTPVHTLLIPPSNGGLVGPIPVGIQFSNGIALAITGAMADSDATAIGAGDVCVNLAYK